MNIIVCVKQVPDTWAERKLREDDKTLDRAPVEAVMNELDEYAVEEALRLKEAQADPSATTVTAVSMGPPRAVDALRKALSMGVDKAILVSDEALHGSCAIQTSYVLASAISTGDWDLVITGSESTDARVGAMGALLGEQLDVAQLSGARKVDIDPAAQTVRIERQTDYGYDVVEAALPAIVAVVEKVNQPRYPSFKGIMAAKNKPLDTLSIADLGIAPENVGLATATSAVLEFSVRPPRGKGEIITDDGDGAKRIADFLAERKLI